MVCQVFRIRFNPRWAHLVPDADVAPKATRRAQAAAGDQADRQSERRRIDDLCHKISRAIVNEAKERNSVIVIGDLKGIRKRAKGRRFRRILHPMPHHRLSRCIEYKALWGGSPRCTPARRTPAERATAAETKDEGSLKASSNVPRVASSTTPTSTEP